MGGFMLVIEPGSPGGASVEYASPPPLDVLQKAVGGYVERVPFFDDFEVLPGTGAVSRCVALVNEEGKLRGLPPNHHAQGFWLASITRLKGAEVAAEANRHDTLVGPVVILWGDDAFMQEL